MKEYITLDKINKKINKQEVLKMLNVKEKDIVYVGGSLIESQVNPISHRIGNEYSDLDLFILRTHEDYSNSDCVYMSEVKRTFFTRYNGVGCDIEIFDVQVIDKIIKSISEIEIKEDKRILNTLELPNGWGLEDVNEFLTRFMYGIPLNCEKEYEEIKKSIQMSKFFKLLQYDNLQRIDNAIEDIRGNLIEGERETALILCREVSLMLIDFILASEYIMNDRMKWAYIKMENIVQEKSDYKEIFHAIKKIQFEDINESIDTEIKGFLSLTEDIVQNIFIEVSL